jgi:hypothetical protein
MRIGLTITVFGLIVNGSFGQPLTELRGDYLGQTPPGDIPVVFAPGIVSDDYQQHGIPSFSPDGNQVLWQTNRELKNEKEEWLSNSYSMRRIENRWSAPEVSPYGNMPFFSPNGNRIYFGDNDNGIGYVDKVESGWSMPKSLGLVARFPELKNTFYPSVSSNGTIYFMGNAPGLWNNLGIYRAEFVNGEYTKPELLPPSINAPGGLRNWAPYIAPDESFLIFCSTRGVSKYDQGDLFISFRKPDGGWTDPMNMGAPINTDQMERFSTLSPNGKFLFFTRDVLPDYYEDVFWVSASVIDRLKEKCFAKQ